MLPAKLVNTNVNKMVAAVSGLFYKPCDRHYAGDRGIVDMIARRLFLHSAACSALLAGGVATAQIPQPEVPVAPAATPAPPRPNIVAKMYADTCASCHGEKMTGGEAPNLVDDEWLHGGTDADIARTIHDGVPGNGMPAFGALMNGEQIRAMVIYIREVHDQTVNAGLRPLTPPALPSHFDSERQSFNVEVVIDGLDYPWGMVFLPDGRLLVSQRPGTLCILDGSTMGAPITGLPPVWVKLDGGLLDLALDPNFKKNGWIYLAFTENGGSTPIASTARIIRGKLRDGALVEQQDVFKATPENYWEDNSHYGVRLLFDQRGHLYFSLGDRGRRQLAQDLSSPYGKLHRVMDDGSIPKDNPFVHQHGAFPSIWTYGNRNQQGLAFDPATGLLWSTEHGERGGDELNVMHKGHNYGWPVITYGMNYDGTPITSLTAKQGMDQPVVQWTPSIAPGSILFYSGKRFARWKNSLFIASLAGQQLLRYEVKGEQVVHQEVIWRGYGRIRTLREAPDGSIYVAMERPGKIVRLVPAP